MKKIILYKFIKNDTDKKTTIELYQIPTNDNYYVKQTTINKRKNPPCFSYGRLEFAKLKFLQLVNTL